MQVHQGQQMHYETINIQIKIVKIPRQNPPFEDRNGDKNQLIYNILIRKKEQIEKK